jgi:CheY-like chemotaxis protein
MTVIDPLLDRSQSSAGARLEGRELAMLGHDVRGALMAVIGAAGQVEAADPGPDLRGQVERIGAAARTLAHLVGLVLGEEPYPDGAASGVETEKLLAHVRRRYAAEAAERGLSFVVEAGQGVPGRLAIDRVDLGRMIDNLVGNAFKFSDAGTVRLSLARAADGSVLIRVTDEGPGLTDGIAGGLAPDDRRAGQGLGLEIVRTLADRTGADLTLGNRPGGGVEALLRLPPVVEAGSAAPSSPLPDLSGLRVLLAEDNPTNQMVAFQMLRALNAEVTVCSDGMEALENFEAGEFDLVVVDIEMPRLSGLDVIRAIRARSDARAQVPIVALTAYAMREHRERIAAAGSNGLIAKPVTSVEALGRSLAAHVSRHPAPAVAPGTTAPEAGPEVPPPLIDQKTYDALVAAIGAETMGELLDKVVADLLAAQRDLANAVALSDWGRVRSASHILISVAGAIGAVRLVGCARELNALAHTDAGERIAAATRRCLGEIDAAVAFARDRRAAG